MVKLLEVPKCATQKSRQYFYRKWKLLQRKSHRRELVVPTVRT